MGGIRQPEGMVCGRGGVQRLRGSKVSPFTCSVADGTALKCAIHGALGLPRTSCPWIPGRCMGYLRAPKSHHNAPAAYHALWLTTDWPANNVSCCWRMS